MSMCVKPVAVAAVGCLLAGCSVAPRRLNPPESIFDTVTVPTAVPAPHTGGQGNTSVPAAEVSLGKADEYRVKKAYSSAVANSDARMFLLEGMVVIDGRCDEFLTKIGLAAQQYQFGSQELTLLGAATAAIQGLTRVASRDIAITSAAFGLTTSSSNAYATAFLLSPDVSSVRDLVDRSRDAFRQAASQSTGDYAGLALSDAVTLLRKYESICTVDKTRH